ncbi:MAG: TatD family hydrolase [Candidatus Thermoplasmatota archaeon]|jgi:TatD-related deoxyribonuclease|nr:TatD family hydrolase [Candidatus Thermoplasmatota archaeon]MEC7365345.1 TatD family hydrolase [Candidatus Thermoplasmatota archaeon]MEC7458250.1 TatD family hydrolase [Candidatus Thermoplasmatota archaeon]MEC9136220.1 TatD family hydrolase [Candidatus Thermoplasmatota archaeon]|tara:strand:+ start:4877 stop:5761 length:885 start_codon:yes stop_codon:yes gene_type:complete
MLEKGKWVGPIIDQHMHLDRTNLFLDAVADFSSSGGTGIMLVHKPSFSHSLPVDLEGYRGAYSDTISMAEEVRKEFGLGVGVVLGPHPVAWEKQIPELGIKASSELHLEAVSLALEYIDSGHAHCLGEVGRPHYPVEEEIWERANDLLLEILSMASSSGTSVQLHVEEKDERTYSELSKLCMSSGISSERAIRHFAPPNVSADFTHGLSATVNVGKGSIETIVETAREAASPWGMETDFLDDNRRPGAVLGPKTVPKRTQQLCSSLLSEGWSENEVESLLTKVHSEWPESLYGL